MRRGTWCDSVLSLTFLAIVIAAAWGGEWATWFRRTPYSAPWTWYVPMLILWWGWRGWRVKELSRMARDEYLYRRDPIGYIRRQILSGEVARHEETH